MQDIKTEPVNKGWSSDKKYYIETADGMKLLLRFTDISEYVRKANRVSLVELAQQYGLKLENGGRKAFHAQNSGGLYIFKDSNRFYHWSSDSKGGAIDFVMKYSGRNFVVAVAQLIGESYEPSTE